ncbi:MAG: hypothetical protein SPJ34_08465 [Candidatus Ornithospirochaeta sp.]|nr:hypothetical protein [Candidatus Ornithospirochaeta sp.]
MKRVKAAYLEQILHFLPKEDIEKEEAKTLLDKEIAKYKHSLEGKLYRIYKEEELEDGSVMIHIRKQYGDAPVGEFLS